MNLRNFLYNSNLNGFTHLLTRELYTFEQNKNCHLVPQNRRNSALWQPHADILEWDPSSNEICYGRYLEYQPNASALFTGSTAIWIGLELTRSGVYFSVWIDSHPIPGYAPRTSQYSDFLPRNTSPDYWIVRLKSAQPDMLADYCNAVNSHPGNRQNLNVIQDFLTETLL